jgi:hypothetical protein
MIQFIEEDYYINLASYDYELLKELAKKVEDKI